MVALSRLIRDYAKHNSKHTFPRRWMVSKNRLNLQTGQYVHFSGKAWQCAVILEWLEQFLETQQFDVDVKSLVWSGNYILRLLQRSRQESLLLTQAEQEEVSTLGAYHVRLFLALNRKYLDWGAYRLFHPRPKVHMCCHLFEVHSSRNPVALATWMDEDWVKNVSHLAKRTHGRTAHRTTLQRYAAGQVARYV